MLQKPAFPWDNHNSLEYSSILTPENTSYDWVNDGTTLRSAVTAADIGGEPEISDPK